MAREEQEIVIRKADDEVVWTCTSTSPLWTRHLKKLATNLGLTGSDLWHGEVYRLLLPVEHVKLLTRKRRVTMSLEAREKRSREMRVRRAGFESSLDS